MIFSFLAVMTFGSTIFFPAVTGKFNVSFSEPKEDGSSIFSLKCQLLKLSDGLPGLLIVPGTTTGRIVAYFEKFFDAARNQKIPCDGSIQNDDKSQLLNDGGSRAYRSMIALLLYVARDRVDVMYAVKELAACMSAPTGCALQRLRKLIGYPKATGDMGMKLCLPEFGSGKRRKGGEQFWNFWDLYRCRLVSKQEAPQINELRSPYGEWKLCKIFKQDTKSCVIVQR